jgi:hypothetical protein
MPRILYDFTEKVDTFNDSEVFPIAIRETASFGKTPAPVEGNY